MYAPSPYYRLAGPFDGLRRADRRLSLKLLRVRGKEGQGFGNYVLGGIFLGRGIKRWDTLLARNNSRRSIAGAPGAVPTRRCQRCAPHERGTHSAICMTGGVISPPI